MNIKKKRVPRKRTYINVPNLFTALNIFCGFLSVIQTIEGNYTTAAWLIFFAAVFDFLDGRIARATGQSNEFGLQMDSLGDVISSGLAPACWSTPSSSSLYPPVGRILFPFSSPPPPGPSNVFTSEGKKSDYSACPPHGWVTSPCIIFIKHAVDVLLRMLVGLVPVVSLPGSTIYDGMPRFSIKERGFNRLKLILFFVITALFLVYPNYVLFPFMIFYILAGIGRAVFSLMSNEDDGEITLIPKEPDLKS